MSKPTSAHVPHCKMAHSGTHQAGLGGVEIKQIGTTQVFLGVVSRV